MFRDLNLILVDHIENNNVNSAVDLFYFDHPEEEIRINSGLGPLEWDGKTWLGIGELGVMSKVSINDRLENKRMTFDLALFDKKNFSYAKVNVRGRSVKIYRAYLDHEGKGQIIPDPVLLWAGRADTVSTAHDKEKDVGNGHTYMGRLILNCHTIDVRLDRGSRNLYDPVRQEIKARKLTGDPNFKDSIFNDIQITSQKKLEWPFGPPS